MSDSIWYLGLLDVSDRIRRRELSSLEVTRSLLDRIERLDPRLRSYQVVLADSAMMRAAEADREIAGGLWRGPLHGVPIAIKDILLTKGVPTLAGMPLRAGLPADEDATAVARLRLAGAVLLGKLHMTEGAMMHHHPELPRPMNPWGTDHWPGVSSSGSGVAVAAGLCFGALGSDTGGSIRMPSSANNVTGIKPTWGRVSRHGLVPLVESMDHLGPMARSTADAAAILQVIAGHDPDDTTTLPAPVPDYRAAPGRLDDLVIGIDRNFVEDGIAPEIVATLRDAERLFGELGARFRQVTMPKLPSYMAVMFSGIAAAHTDYYPAQADRYSPEFRKILEVAISLDPAAVARAYQDCARYAGAMNRLLDEVDLLLLPGLGAPVPSWPEMETVLSIAVLRDHPLMRFTTPFNISGLPTISLPAGFGANGLPIGIQLAGPKLSEPLLIRAGSAFQAVSDAHTRHPPLD